MVREIEKFIERNFNVLKTKNEITEADDNAIIYFSSIFVLTNYKIANKDFIERFFNDFLLIENKTKDKEITIPLLKLFNFLIKKDVISVASETENKLEIEYKKLSKKFNDLIIKAFVTKNRNELPYYRRDHKKT